jgi:hypothetical protein
MLKSPALLLQSLFPREESSNLKTVLNKSSAPKLKQVKPDQVSLLKDCLAMNAESFVSGQVKDAGD